MLQAFTCLWHNDKSHQGCTKVHMFGLLMRVWRLPQFKILTTQNILLPAAGAYIASPDDSSYKQAHGFIATIGVRKQNART